MGSAESGKGSRDIAPKKIDDSQGMCGSESDYDTCWSRICNPNRSTVLRDVLRGLLVLIGLAIVITIIFLLCYFLINDMEKKEEEIVDTLIKDFSSGNKIEAESEFSIDGNRLPPSDLDTYETVPPLIGGLGPDGARLHKEEEEPKLIEQLGNQGTFGNIVVESGTPQDEGDLVNAFAPAKDVIDLAYDTTPEVIETGAACVPLRLPLCSGSMPWSLSAFPNFVNNKNLLELQESLKYFQSIIVGSRCSTRATEYTCAILEPSCGPDMVPLPPCRAFCEDIVQTCSEFFITGNEHNSAFQCSRYPDSKDPNVCVDISRAAPGLPTQPSEPQTDTADKAMVEDGSVVAQQDIAGIPLEAVQEGREDTASQNAPETETPETNQNPNPESKTDAATAISNVTETPVFICDHSKFLCVDGSDCLGGEFVCDGIQHCLDNSDEFNCTKQEQTQPEQKPECTGDDFLCTSTKYCISRSWVCDGADDCTDNSDETNCDNVNDRDNFLAQESNLTPELFSLIPNGDLTPEQGIIPSLLEEGGAVNHPNVFTETEKVKSSENVPLPETSEDKILAEFSKFGDDSDRNFGTEIVEEMFKDKEQPSPLQPEVDRTQESNDENSDNSNDGNTDILKQDGVDNSNNEETRVTVQNGRRRRPLNPNLRRRRPIIPTSTPQEISVEDSEPAESIAEITSTRVEEWDKNENRQSERPLNGDIRRRRPGRISIQNRNHFGNKRDRVEQDDKQTDESPALPNESVLEEDVPRVPHQGDRIRTRRPILPVTYESLKTRTPIPLRKPPSRRPIPLVRRRPTKKTYHGASLSEKVEDFLKEESQETLKEQEQEEDSQPSIIAQAMPITIPEQMVPTNVQNRNPSPDDMKETRTDEAVNQQPIIEEEIQEQQYDDEEISPPVEYQLPSKTYQHSQILPPQQHEQNQQGLQQYEDSQIRYEAPTQTYPQPPQEYERVPTQYEPSPQQYNIPLQRYENSHPEYKQTHASLQTQINPQINRQQQYEEPTQHFVKSQVHFKLGNLGQQQEYSNTGQNYYHGNIQAAEYVDNPTYSQQTYQHPVYSENVYEYANPDEFPYGKAHPAMLGERYPSA